MKATNFLEIAYIISQSSKCCSWRVGALIEKNGRIISTGYNGSPAGAVNCCDHAEKEGWVGVRKHNGTGLRQEGLIPTKKVLLKEHRPAHSAWSAKNEIHAELNAILFAARNGMSIEGATMYVTLSPCGDCAKAIAQSGIKKVVFSELYDRSTPDWSDILKESGVEVFQIPRRSLSHINWSQIKNYLGE